MVTRFFALTSVLALGLVGLVACSGENSGSLDGEGNGNGTFVPPEGTPTNTPAPATSAPTTKSNTGAPVPTASTKPDAGPAPSKDACTQLAKCCDKITNKPVQKLACSAAAASGQEQLCAPALQACEGDGGA